MKKHLLLFSMVLILGVALGQTKPKQNSNKEPTIQKETVEKLKEMQKGMDELNLEDKKVMDGMSVTLASLNNTPDFSDTQLKEESVESSMIIPEKGIARIASISKTPLTTSSLPAFLTTIYAEVIPQLKADSKTKGEQIYQIIKAEHNSTLETGNAAIGLWMMGDPELAIYIMGKSCMDDPSNVYNLSNYASMLSMAGAEQLSLPILNNLNKRFPKNSTILNNIGQAWFGLGDINKSTTYLDSTIHIFAYHPQANFTKSFIEESKGNKQGAIDAAKRSIKSGYSTEKEDRLYKLGYDLDSNDIYWDKPMPQDPLGLEKFKQPDYPKSVETSKALESEWEAFMTACDIESERLQSQSEQLEEAMEAAHEKRSELLLQAGKNGLMVDLMPRLASKAVIKLRQYNLAGDEQYALALQKQNEAILSTDSVVNSLKDRYEEDFLNNNGLACKVMNDAGNKFLKTANQFLESVNTDYLNFLRRTLNDKIYYCQYTMWPEDFEVEKIHAKIQWLGAISSRKPEFHSKCIENQPDADVEPKPFKLQEFDDVHCEYHSEYKSPVGTINVDCSRMTTKLDLKMIKLGLKQDMNKNTFGEQFMSCSVEVGASESAGFNTALLKAEASVGIAMRAEFDRTGLTDVIVKAEAGVGLGTNFIEDGSKAGVGVKDLSVEAGVEGQISLISGKSSVESNGVLKNVFKKEN